MKIAIIGTRGIPGRYSGVEISVDELSRRLGEKGHQIIVYCRIQQDNKIKRNIYKNIRLIFLPTIKSKHLETIVHVFYSSVHLLFLDVDIVHFHALGASIFSFLPRLFGKKTIVTIHSLDWKRKKWKYFAQLFLKLCEYPAIFFPNKTVVVSKTLKDYFERKFRKEVYYIPNGTNISPINMQENSNSKNGKYILFVGRLVPEKGIHYLIKASNELKMNLKLIIAGTSSFTDKYVRYLKNISGENIEFAGFVQGKALQILYQKAYLFVLPSEVEGLSVSLLEAMSYGKCALVSNIPECLEVTGDCGISFKSGDYLDLKAKLQYLINNPKFVAEMGLKAQKRVMREYNWDKIIDDIEELHASLIPHKKQGK